MIEEIINEQPTFEEMSEQLIGQFKKADHFYITFFNKSKDRIESRRCFWDSKSKIWETKDGKIAVCCVAMDNEEYTISGYRTFTNIFNITGRKAMHTSEVMQ